MTDAKGWDDYWQSQQGAQALQVKAGSTDPLESHWQTCFSDVLARRRSANVLELACGNGALIATLTKQATPPLITVGLDISVHGIASFKQRCPESAGVVGNAGALPFTEKSFDLIVSQFGAEYAGAGAIIRALSLLKSKGTMVVLMHYQGSDIYQASKHACQCLDELKKIRVLAESKTALLAAISCAHGSMRKQDFVQIDRNFAPVVKSLETIIRSCKHGDLANKLKRLYGDLGRIYKMPDRYQHQEVAQWFDGLIENFSAYHRRMNALVDAALSEEQLADLKQHIMTSDCSMITWQPLIANQFDFGWQMNCQRIS